MIEVKERIRFRDIHPTDGGLIQMLYSWEIDGRKYDFSAIWDAYGRPMIEMYGEVKKARVKAASILIREHGLEPLKSFKFV
jgi:hypothetical protein